MKLVRLAEAWLRFHSPMASRVKLAWPGRDAAPARPANRRSIAGLELESPGHPSTMLIAGDNLPALRALETRAPSSVTLAYLDPPFLTNRTHHRIERSRADNGEIKRTSKPAFDDRWDNLESYLETLGRRIEVIRELLSDDGCLVLHVDPKTSHYLKVLCDEIFGPDCFASEIVWRYRRWPAKTPNFQRVHDVLLRYVKNSSVRPKFRQLYEPLAASTQATWGTGKQRAVVDSKGRRQRSSTTSEPTPGTPLGDVWELSILAPVSRERTGYPTQKPEALLERLLQACTDPGDLVLDPYSGSGTTLAVAARLGRRAIGINDNPEAVGICRERLAKLEVEPLVERVVTRAKHVRATTPRSRASTRRRSSPEASVPVELAVGA